MAVVGRLAGHVSTVDRVIKPCDSNGLSYRFTNCKRFRPPRQGQAFTRLSAARRKVAMICAACSACTSVSFIANSITASQSSAS